MKMNEYQKLAMRTAKGLVPKDLIINGSMGLCGESGEVIDILKKHMFQGHELEKDKLINELGDVFWYLAITCEGLGTNLETVARKNVEKLKKRYPEGFESERSINREKEKVTEIKKGQIWVCGRPQFDKNLVGTELQILDISDKNKIKCRIVLAVEPRTALVQLKGEGISISAECLIKEFDLKGGK